MKEDQKINLICRIAGNIASGDYTRKSVIDLAFEIFERVEKRVKEESEGENEN